MSLQEQIQLFYATLGASGVTCFAGLCLAVGYASGLLKKRAARTGRLVVQYPRNMRKPVPPTTGSIANV